MDGTTAAGDRRDWLALASVKGVGPGTAQHLLALYGSPAALLASRREELIAAGVSADLARALSQPDWRAVDRACAWLEETGDERNLLTLQDATYPELLRQIADPPLLLFIRGRRECLVAPQLAVVGSRNPSADGRGVARDFARQLGRAGLTISSGLAVGIDAAAHEGALDAGGATIAVSGCGPDRIYPQRHAELAERILAGAGALVSEFFPGTPPRAAHFPRRNRIISGLSAGVLVVEAALRSGSLITARYASEQGREVFAIPGSIHTPQARGCHHLIRQGAKLVESEQDILEELGPLLHVARVAATPDAGAAEILSDLSAEALQLLRHIGAAPASVDSLVARSGLTADAVSSILLLLELRGLVASQPGGTYSRLRRDNT